MIRTLPKVRDEAGTGGAKASSGEQPVSFVRPRKEQRIARVPATPQATDIDLNASALIVVDMQNDFVHPDGWFAGKGIDLSPIRAVIPSIERLATGLRRADIPVIWLNWGVRADRANLPVTHR